ncbi:Arginase family enzyme [Mariniphaga anaerophila]|uniref:Arginase family enzyme n=1 Tax=Mariniphaga anaerophila TaxID=1484053 RepID=A0A1M5FT42_9BACT|nr:arginase family protein [Mariniphaga anaerophila]SHF94361.1 Arginase family enzyme [Mariniphaga anaerophila]
MKLHDYFEPVDFSRYAATGPLGKFALGPAIEKSNAKYAQLNPAGLDVAIIGVPVENGERKRNAATDSIRSALYQLAALNKNLKIADFGNLKSAKSPKGTMLALRDVIDYLRELNVATVVLGGSQDLTTGICDAFINDRFFSLATVDSTFDIKKGVEPFNSTNYLTRIFKRLPNLFHFSLIGYQTHLAGEKLIGQAKNFGEYVRLGQLRDDFSYAELLLRNSNVLSFDVGAIKYSEAPSTTQKNPNGLYGAEACQLARYAGLSTNLNAFGLFNVIKDKSTESEITTKLAAEIVWYFLEGISGRKTPSERTVYKVEIEGLEYPIVFRHEQETDRWWFEVRSISGEKLEIACTEYDYREAAENEIPGRWLAFIQKMDSLSK